MRARRSALSVPRSSERMLAKAAALPADEIVFDLEDAVALPAKDERAASWPGCFARGSALHEPWRCLNGLDSGCCHCDVLVLVEQAGPEIDSLVLPKVECAEDVRWLDRSAAQRHPGDPRDRDDPRLGWLRSPGAGV